jgi:hypothetical protein
MAPRVIHFVYTVKPSAYIAGHAWRVVDIQAINKVCRAKSKKDNIKNNSNRVLPLWSPTAILLSLALFAATSTAMDDKLGTSMLRGQDLLHARQSLLTILMEEFFLLTGAAGPAGMVKDGVMMDCGLKEIARILNFCFVPAANTITRLKQVMRELVIREEEEHHK